MDGRGNRTEVWPLWLSWALPSPHGSVTRRDHARGLPLALLWPPASFPRLSQGPGGLGELPLLLRG